MKQSIIITAGQMTKLEGGANRLLIKTNPKPKIYSFEFIALISLVGHSKIIKLLIGTCPYKLLEDVYRKVHLCFILRRFEYKMSRTRQQMLGK